MIFSSLSCDSAKIKWDPIWYVGDYESGGVINRYHHFVPASDEQFNDFSCLPSDKRTELLNLLRQLQYVKKKRKISHSQELFIIQKIIEGLEKSNR